MELRVSYYFQFPFPCVYREEATPSSIPNLAVKLLFADDTAPFRCGNVGRCRVGSSFYFQLFFINFIFSCLETYLFLLLIRDIDYLIITKDKSVLINGFILV